MMMSDHAVVRESALKRNRIFGITARISTSLFGLLATSLVIQYLGASLYGMWLVLSTIPGWLACLEFGAGPILRNKVAACEAIGDRDRMRQEVSSLFVALSVIAGVCLLIYLVAQPMIPFERLLNLEKGFSPQEVNQIKSAATFLVVLSLLSLPITVAGHVVFGLQRTYLVEISAVLASGTVLIGMAVLVWTNWERHFLGAVGLLGGASVVYAFGLFLAVFFVMYPWLRPRMAEGWGQASRLLNRQGAYFTGQHLSSLVAPLGESFIMLHLLSSATVAQVGIIQRWYVPLGLLHSTIMQPLQPAFAEAVHRGDLPWARVTVSRFTRRSMILVGLGGVGLLVCEPAFVQLIGHGLVSDDTLLGGLILLRTLQQTWTGSWGIFLYAMGEVGSMVLYNWVGSVLYIPLALVMGSQWGAIGVVGAGLLAYLPVAMSNYIEAKRVLLARSSNMEATSVCTETSSSSPR